MLRTATGRGLRTQLRICANPGRVGRSARTSPPCAEVHAEQTHATKTPARTQRQWLQLNPKLRSKCKLSHLNFSLFIFCAFVSIFRTPANKATDTMPPPQETHTQLPPSASSPKPPCILQSRLCSEILILCSSIIIPNPESQSFFPASLPLHVFSRDHGTQRVMLLHTVPRLSGAFIKRWKRSRSSF